MELPGPVDGLEITILVDNVTDGLSTTPSFVETELAGLRRRRRGKWVLSGSCICCAAHGLSCLVSIRRGTETRTILFDSGPEDRVFEQNVSRLGVDLGAVTEIVLSHGHFDHAAGMLRALQLIRDRNGAKDVRFHAHPDMFRQRATRQADGGMLPLEAVPSVVALTEYGADVVSTREPQSIAAGMVFVSGEIPRVTPFERGLPGQHRLRLDGSGWEPDELIMDERYIAVDVAEKGLVVFSACSHAGIVNVLTHARDCFPDRPIHAVIGGFHLSGANEKIIPETVEALRALDPAYVLAGHCTGWRAVAALCNAFGTDRLAPLAVGKRITF